MVHHLKVYTEEVVRELAKDLLECSLKKEYITNIQWINEHEMSYHRMIEIGKEFPFFREAYDIYMQRVGQRRELMAMYDEDIIDRFGLNRFAGAYNPGYLRYQKEIKESEKKEDSSTETLKMISDIVNVNRPQIEKS